MTVVKITGKPTAVASRDLEEKADWLFNNPKGHVIGIVEFAHLAATTPAPDAEKERTVEVRIVGLNLATPAQEETLRKAASALHLQKTTEGTLDPDGDVEMAQKVLDLTEHDLALRESIRLRAAMRLYASKARDAFLAHALTTTELRHELESIAAGLRVVLEGVEER